jgi:hypothetical protein
MAIYGHIVEICKSLSFYPGMTICPYPIFVVPHRVKYNSLTQ